MPYLSGVAAADPLSRKSSVSSFTAGRWQPPNSDHSIVSDTFVGYGAPPPARGVQPALRRASSATSVRPRESNFGLRASSAPRRRPGEPPQPSPVPGYPPAARGEASVLVGHAEALQLETSLTERLRGHSFSALSAETSARRPLADRRPRRDSGTALPGASALWPQRPARIQGREPVSRGLGTPGAGIGVGHPAARLSDADPRLARPMLHGDPLGRSGHQRHAPEDWRRPDYSRLAAADRAANRRPSPASVTTPVHEAQLEDSAGALSETRLKVYSDLFEEVIGRDRVFGSLLRKIKTAYDLSLSHTGTAPALPSRTVPNAADPSGGGGRQSSDAHSQEPTTRAEKSPHIWELQRENRALKDLVERLHLELEDAARREQKYRARASDLQAHATAGGALESPSKAVPSCGRQTQSSMAMEPAWGGAPKPARRSFEASRREPSPADLLGPTPPSGGPLSMQDQAALLSLSSISPRNSAQHGGESFEFPPRHAPQGPMHAGRLGGTLSSAAARDGLEDDGEGTARSSDSAGGLPQRPTPRKVQRPGSVPPLDLSRLAEDREEEDEADLEDEEEAMQSAGTGGDQSPRQLNGFDWESTSGSEGAPNNQG